MVNAQLAKQYLQQQVDRQTEQMATYHNTLSAVLERYEYLPAVLRQNDELFRLATQSPEQASDRLKSIRDASGADVVYILRPDGETIAASNRGETLSFMGKNYSFRPYYTKALQSDSGRGHFFGIGTTTNVPGHFVSTRYPLTGAINAVLVIKVNLTAIEASWPSGGERVFVSDRNGVIIMSSDDEWRYKTLQPLNDGQKALIDRQKQFANEPLDSLDIPDLVDGNHRVRIANVDYVHTLDTSIPNDWKIHYLTPYTSVISRLYTFWSGALILLLAALALALLIRTLNIRNALRHSQGESSTLRMLNQSLEHEIIERKQVEVALRQTQADLRRSSKLAAMGQLSASITHELSQPLAAMRTYLASLSNQLRSENGQPISNAIATQPLPETTPDNPAHRTLGKLTGLTERMITISQQLRYFARSSDNPTQLMDLKEALQGALNISQPAILQAGAELIINEPPTPVNVVAGRVRIEQVIVNLIKNALDAMAENTRPSILSITLEVAEQHVVLIVADTGPGLPSKDRERLFEPFYSTKPSGVGMGLGLAISGNIVAELGGSLDAENGPQGGARFIITLSLHKDEEDQ
ncbi:MAG: sensor histidine kinase [Thiolinea sp.]